MSEPTNPSYSKAASRAEKLSILSAMLGPDAMARVREARPSGTPPTKPDQVEINADRAAWHRNRLLERLRQQSPVHAPKSIAGPTAPTATVRAEGGPRSADQTSMLSLPVAGLGLDARLAKFSDFDSLGQEHPAIIARLIKNLSRDDRVEALKSLPGPVARSIVRRLR